MQDHFGASCYADFSSDTADNTYFYKGPGSEDCTNMGTHDASTYVGVFHFASVLNDD